MYFKLEIIYQIEINIKCLNLFKKTKIIKLQILYNFKRLLEYYF